MSPSVGRQPLDDAVLEVLATLTTGMSAGMSSGDTETDAAWPEVEVYAKSGRSRTLSHRGRRQVTSLRRENGWAVRAGDARRSFFLASSGLPRADSAWPEGDGAGLRLPSAQPVSSWTPPAELDAALIGENEARALIDGIARALDHEVPGARLIGVDLEDGSSDSQLASSREVRSRVRRRAAILRLEAIGPGRPTHSVTVVRAAREARRFHPAALASRLADRLLIAAKGTAPTRDRGELLLAPPVVARLLDALESLWLGPEAAAALGRLADGGRLGSRVVTLIDDGRLAGGLLEAPVDGEGLPTRAVRLLDRGRIGHPLLAWWQTPTRPRQASGCSQRASWRDLPRPGPTHLYLAPDPTVAVATLLADVSRGYYLLDVEGLPRIDLEKDRFALPVCGFAIDRGQATGAISGAWLVGSIRAFFHGVVAVGRDLTFMPLRGMIGAPTTLVRGLELRHRP